jgi:hypothetical protein
MSSAKMKLSSQEDRLMEKTKSDPIIIEQAGMRMTVEHRHGVGGTDEGLTFDITTAVSGLGHTMNWAPTYAIVLGIGSVDS